MVTVIIIDPLHSEKQSNFASTSCVKSVVYKRGQWLLLINERTVTTRFNFNEFCSDCDTLLRHKFCNELRYVPVTALN